jgi:hypothetical protein
MYLLLGGGNYGWEFIPYTAYGDGHNPYIDVDTSMWSLDRRIYYEDVVQ